MNALSEVADFEPNLLNLNHSPNQKLKFTELRVNGTIALKVHNLTVPEACYQSAIDAGVQPFDDFPEFDQTTVKGNKIVHSKNGIPVFVDRTKQTPISVITKRSVPHRSGELKYTLIEGMVYQLTQHTAEGTMETTDFVKSVPIRWFKRRTSNLSLART